MLAMSDDNTLTSGPLAAAALSQLTSLDLSKMPFMAGADADVASVKCRVTRCGYTGEDGFEVWGLYAAWSSERSKMG